MMKSRMHVALVGAQLMTAALGATAAASAEEPEVVQYGNTPSRNMVSGEKGLPSEWDVSSGRNIKWSAKLGSQSYAGPVVSGGKVFVGTNNENQRNAKLKGDRGNVMAFRESDGEFLWQSAHPKLPAGRVNDWPLQGVCSTPVIEGDRLYYISNRAEIVCADMEAHEASAVAEDGAPHLVVHLREVLPDEREREFVLAAFREDRCKRARGERMKFVEV